MKKIMTIAIAAAMLCTPAGCGRTAEHVPTGATLEIPLTHSYKAEEILAEEKLGWTHFFQFGEQVLTYTPADTEDASSILGLYDVETGKFIRRETKISGILGTAVQEDTIDVMIQETNPETYDFQLSLVTYDKNLSVVQSEDVTEQLVFAGQVLDWVRDAQGNEYFSIPGNGVYCMSPDGISQSIDGTEGNESLFIGRDGHSYAVQDQYTLLRLNGDTMTSEVIPLELPDSTFGGTLASGNTLYDVMYRDDKALYGITLSDGSVTEVLNWQNSDIGTPDAALLLPDGRVLFSEYGTGTNWLLTERTQEEMDSLRQITIAMMDTSQTSWLREMVYLYNRQADGCRITIRNYFDPNLPDSGEGAFEQDLLDGIAPDILVWDQKYHMLSNKGMFEDLRDWMENDPEFQEDEYLMNLFESMAYRGRMERMPFAFTASTYMAKTEHLDGAQRLTLADYAELELPEGMELLANTDRQSSFEILMRSQIGAFVDYENAECSFDEEEFISLLEWFGTFPEKAAVPDDYAYRENRALLCPTDIYNLRDFHFVREYPFGGAEITLTGTPISSEGNGGVFLPIDRLTMTMSSNSLYKEEIWNFIKFCLRADNQEQMDFYGFPVNLEAMQTVMEREMTDSGHHSNYMYMYFAGEEVEVSPATAEDAAMVTEYFRGITVCGVPDDFIYNIAKEETDKFFAGDCTAEDAARVIQSRVSLYLAEQN